MSEVTWGSLAKTIDDKMTISEEIDADLLEHNEDPSAHGQTNEAVSVHRVADILDHLDGSVTDIKQSLDRYALVFSFESLDAWAQVVVGTGVVRLHGGSIELDTGGDINSSIALWLEARTEEWGVLFANNPRFAINALFEYAGNQEIYFISGDIGEDGFGFMVEGSILYAVSFKATVRSRVELTNEFDIAVWKRFKAIYTSGSKIDYYIGKDLKHTQTTNLPVQSEVLLLYQIKILSIVAQQRVANFASLVFDQEL